MKLLWFVSYADDFVPCFADFNMTLYEFATIPENITNSIGIIYRLMYYDIHAHSNGI